MAQVNSITNKGGYYRRDNSTIERYTPIELYQEWNAIFNFTTDACTNPTNRLGCKVYFTKETDGLTNVDKWQGNVWINPPYDRTTGKWVKAALDYGIKNKGNYVVMLLKSTTGVKWFHNYIWDSQTLAYRLGVAYVYFLQKRVNFISSKTGEPIKDPAPFDSMIVVFGQQPTEEKNKPIPLQPNGAHVWDIEKTASQTSDLFAFFSSPVQEKENNSEISLASRSEITSDTQKNIVEESDKPEKSQTSQTPIVSEDSITNNNDSQQLGLRKCPYCDYEAEKPEWLEHHVIYTDRPKHGEKNLNYSREQRQQQQGN